MRKSRHKFTRMLFEVTEFSFGSTVFMYFPGFLRQLFWGFSFNQEENLHLREEAIVYEGEKSRNLLKYFISNY